MKKLPSAKQVESWKTPGRHAVGFGCYLQISGDAGRSWVFRYQHSGRARHVGLGPVSEVTLAQARDKALHYRRTLREAGVDPLTSRAAARNKIALDAAKVITFGEVATSYIASHRAGWRNQKHATQWETTLKTHAAAIMPLPVQSIDKALVLNVLEPIWTTRPETASRLRGRIESVLDFAKARDFRDGDNPARWRGHLDKLLPARNKVAKPIHHAALPYQELPAFMTMLRERPGFGARALEFTILTACRTGEVLQARWEEISADGVWTIPAARTKAHRDHRVPLSKSAIAILSALPRESDFVFQSRSTITMLKTLHRMGRVNVTTHGFRATFKTWASERTSFQNEIVEACLAHAIGNKVEQAYQRGDLFEKRARLMREWANYCNSPVAVSGDVVALRP